MAYKKGEVEFAAEMYDSRETNDDGMYLKAISAVYLPHSCDEWVIGGKKEIQDLIDDLIKILKSIEQNFFPQFIHRYI